MVETIRNERILLREDLEYYTASVLHSSFEEENSDLDVIPLIANGYFRIFALCNALTQSECGKLNFCFCCNFSPFL